MKKPKRNPQMAWRQLGEDTLIIDSRINKEVHRLNSVGGLIWSLCDGQRDMDQIVDEIVSQYDITPADALGDVQTYIDILEKKELLMEV